MPETQNSRLRPGDTLRKPADAARQRFGRTARWLWGKVKTPGFPQPIYIGGAPSFIDREIDDYLASNATNAKIAA